MAEPARRRRDEPAPLSGAGASNGSATTLEDVKSAIARARKLDAEDSADSLPAAMQGVTLSLALAAPALQAEAKACLASCQLHHGVFDGAFSSANAAIALWSFVGDKAGEAVARCVLAELLEKLGETDKALEESLLAQRLADGSADLRAQTLANIVVGVICTSLRQYDEALVVLRNAETAAAALDDPLLLPRALNNLGNVHNDRGSALLRRGEKDAAIADLTQGRELYQRAADLFASAGDVRLEGIAQRNIALGLSLLRRFDEADVILDRQLRVARTRGSKVSEESTLRFKGTAYLEQGRFGDAVAVLQQARVIAADMRYPERELASHEMLATAYEGLGELASALHHFRKFHDQQARLVNDVNQRRARAMALQFQAERAKGEAAEAKLRAHHLETSNQKLIEETARLSAEMLIDPLTGLFNRRHLDLVLRPELSRRDAASSFSVALVDIDYFKRVNDDYSHQVGDDVLRHVGAILRGGCRQGEFAIRYGGEEFALVFPSACVAEARGACERVRLSIERHAWSAIRPGLRVTVSAGVADHAEAETFDTVLAIADQRLYQAKAQGRNRVVATGTA